MWCVFIGFDLDVWMFDVMLGIDVIGCRGVGYVCFEGVYERV